MSDYSRAKLRQLVKDNGPVRCEISTLLPESRNQRAYLMGCIIPLIVYLDGGDYRDTKTLEYYFEFLKRELSPDLVMIKGKAQVFGKSTKGSKALNGFLERSLEYLNEQYGIEYDNQALLPDSYKHFRDAIYPFQKEFDCYLDYCIKSKWIKKIV